MTKSAEIENLISHIPNQKDYASSNLIITIPTSSTIEIDDVKGLIQDHAIPKGWNESEIKIIKKSGYFACKTCGKTVHIHVKSPEMTKCLNCGSEKFEVNQAEIDVTQQ